MLLHRFLKCYDHRSDVVQCHEEREAQEQPQRSSALGHEGGEVVDVVLLLHLHLRVGKHDLETCTTQSKLILMCDSLPPPNLSLFTIKVFPTCVYFL